MALFLLYLLKVHLCISLLFTAWYFLLRKNKFLLGNRFLLLSIILLSFIVPLLPAIPHRGLTGYILQESSSQNGQLSALPQVPPAVFAEPELPAPNPQNTILRLLTIAGWLYLAVSGMLLCRLLVQLFNVASVIYSSRRLRSQGAVYCEPASACEPFSFFNYIVVQRTAYTNEQYLQIISHEYVHCTEHHSVDTLLAELMHILLWVNPLSRWLKRCLRSNLEFLADDRVISSGIDETSYQLNILRFTSGRPVSSVTTGYSSLLVKERIRMMNTVHAPANRRYLALILLPFVLLGYLAVTPARGQENYPVTIAGLAELHALSGYYGLKYHQNIRIQVNPDNGTIKLLQLWDNLEITFKRQSRLRFYNEQRKFQLDFVADNQGKITGLIAMRKDHWVKLRDDDPNVKKQIINPKIREVAIN